MLTQNELKELLDYDVMTGVFRWKIRAGRCRAGDIAGTPLRTGHWKITIHGRIYPASHLAWLYVRGEWPPGKRLDHKDRDSTNDSLDNLRPASVSNNAANSKLYRNNTSGHRGVRQFKGRWRAAIYVNKKQIHLGTFESKEEAIAAYNEAATEAFGDFANLGQGEQLNGLDSEGHDTRKRQSNPSNDILDRVLS